MNVASLIAELEGRSILLSLDGGQIRYRSPRQALTDADREALRAHRGEIIAYLHARNAGRASRAAPPLAGPLTPSIVQEMWLAFAGGAEEGKPVAINISLIGQFKAAPEAVIAAVRQVIARHDALRVRFEERDGALQAFLNPAEAFAVEQEDLRGMGTDAARAAAAESTRHFCSLLKPALGRLLTRAKVFALPDGETIAAISSSHMVADAGTRNILLDELYDILETGAPRASAAVLYNDYSLAEREFFAGEQGAQLIEYWRRWYHDQPTMLAPSDKVPLLWGNGVRIVKNFAIPSHVADKVRDLAGSLKVTPFLIYLTIFAVAMARWAKTERFPVRILGDKRISMDLSNTVGLMYCADPIAVHVPAQSDFETIMRGILAEYDAALALRAPSLHYWAPHCVRPGIEAPDHPNKIPAVFNYYSQGTVRERAEKQAIAGTSAKLPWPPQIETLSQVWPRRSAPLFWHLNDTGHEVLASLHFFQGAVSPADQDSFTAMLFQVFSEVVSV